MFIGFFAALFLKDSGFVEKRLHVLPEYLPTWGEIIVGAIVRDHLPPLCRAVKGNAMFVGDKGVMPSVHD